MKRKINELYGMIINLASAYVNNHKLKEANQVIEKRFGKPGMRKQYKEVFEFLEIQEC